MKNLLLSFGVFLLSFGIAIAQTTPAGENISLAQQLSLVNQSSVTWCIIYERAVQLNFNSS